MHEIKYPYFKKDRILKIEMLENLRDYPRDILEIYSERLSDGIISGLNAKVEKEIITFSKGIVKYKGQIYLIGKPIDLYYSDTDVEVVIKMRFLDNNDNNDFKIQNIKVIIDSNIKIENNEIELGRFKLKKGAYLRSDYQDLYDFTTEYITINLVLSVI